MKNAITRNMSNTLLATAHVIPTDTMSLPSTEPVEPVQDLINDAFSHRPELAQSRIDLVNRGITKKATRNALLPSVDLVAWYGSSALAGNTNPLAICGARTSTSNFCIPANEVGPPTGFTNAFSDMFGYNQPDYAVGFNVNIPIRNRSAQATQVRSELEYNQAQLLMQQLQNQISIEVRNAQFTVQQNRAQVEAAQKAEELARQSLDAEQKKYALGASTNTLVLQNQRDLTQAQSNTVTALDTYEKSRVELDRVTGLTLNHLGIAMGDAEKGHVQSMPHAPGVTARPPEQATPVAAPTTPDGTNPQTTPSATPPQSQTAPGTVQPQTIPPPTQQPPQQPQ